MTSLSDGETGPDVSVVIPTHNRSGLLEQTLGTVLWQEDVDLEVIVVDDGSTDNTGTVVQSLNDPRVRLVRHDVPQGVSGARNRGIADARGRWVAMLDDDDLWAPKKLASQLRAAEEAGRAWVYTGAVIINIDNRVIGAAPILPPETVAKGLRRANLVPGGCSGVLVRRDFLPGENAFDGSYYHFADWDLWIRLAARGMPAWVPEPLVGYRVHLGSASHDTEGMIAELGIIEVRYGEPVDRVGFYRHVARVSLRGGRRRHALRYFARAAALGNRAYLRHGFLSDVREVSDELLQALGRRSGLPIPSIGSRAWRDLSREWRQQAASWLAQVPRAAG
jgi:glycosyltransferase involved in cell wall biosynthesis